MRRFGVTHRTVGRVRTLRPRRFITPRSSTASSGASGALRDNSAPAPANAYRVGTRRPTCPLEVTASTVLIEIASLRGQARLSRPGQRLLPKSVEGDAALAAPVPAGDQPVRLGDLLQRERLRDRNPQLAGVGHPAELLE